MVGGSRKSEGVQAPGDGAGAGAGRGGAGRASFARLNPEPQGLWPRSPGCCPRQGAGTWRGCRKVTPVAPEGGGLQDRAWSPSLGEPWTRSPAEFHSVRLRNGTLGLSRGREKPQRGQKGGWGGASWVLEGHPAGQPAQVPGPQGLLAVSEERVDGHRQIKPPSLLSSLVFGPFVPSDATYTPTQATSHL